MLSKRLLIQQQRLGLFRFTHMGYATFKPISQAPQQQQKQQPKKDQKIFNAINTSKTAV
jgi:hypothetical protein